MHADSVATIADIDLQELRNLDTWNESQNSFFVDALAHASKHGDVVRLGDLLDASKRAYPITNDPYAAYHMALVYACMFAKIEAVTTLLKDSRVEPCYRQNAALRVACSIDNEGIVQTLLDDPRVDPSFDDCAVLFTVCELGGYKVIPCLLSHPSVQRVLRTDLLRDHAFRFRNTMALREIIIHAKPGHASGLSSSGVGNSLAY